ncbi:MAG: PAS domain-containing protein [Alphaproteobacteria bacterium]|nr:PAS domain-containing protein [Alphaproteobacteria bacterium]
MRPVQGQKALDAKMAGSGNEDNAEMEHRRLVEAIGAAGDVAYAWDVRSGSLDWLAPVPDALGGQFAALHTADGFAARIFPEDATLRAEALARHLSGAGAYECEYRIRDDHDDPVWVHDRGIARRDAAGQPLSIAGVLRLTGARKAREAQLDTSPTTTSSPATTTAPGSRIRWSRRWASRGATASRARTW